MMPVPWMLWEGQVVDLCFPLRQYIGGTDRSAVYLTQYGDPEPRDAAIKLILAGAPEGEILPEWKRAARLSHPNLLRLFRSGSCRVNQTALRYVVTEYAEEDLAAVLAERALTTVEVREMLQPLLEALAYIHGEGLVHGHLKPANIMAVGDQLKLSVDGISLVGEPGNAQSTAGRYDPPEFGDRGCSPVGDVWSFGVTLVEALTQRLPIAGGPKEEPVLPETLPAEFLPMARACLRPDPRRRASLGEVLAQFQRMGRDPVEQPVVEPPAPARKWRSLALVSAAALALAAILAVPRLAHQSPPGPPADQPVVAPASTREAAKPETPPTAEVVESQPASSAPAVAVVPTAPAPVATTPDPAPHAPLRSVDAKPGQVVHEVLPDVTDQARRTIRGTVRIHVRASVDASGRVSDAQVESQNSRYFANLTLQAARQWSFEADAAGEWLLRFEFTTKGTTVHPARVAQ